MSAATVQLPSVMDTLRLTSGFHDDFDAYTDAQRWTKVLSDSGSVGSLASGDNGQIAIVPSDGSVGDNDESYVHTTNSLFKIVADRMLQIEMSGQYTEANTDDANILACAVMDSIGANTLVDDGGGVKTSFSGAAIYKVDGGSVWKCISSVGAVQTITATGIAPGGASFYRLKIEIRALTSTTAEVTFWYSTSRTGRFEQFLDPTQKVATPIKHIITYTGAVAMQVGAGVKNGFTNLETLNLDYVSAYQTRVAA